MSTDPNLKFLVRRDDFLKTRIERETPISPGIGQDSLSHRSIFADVPQHPLRGRGRYVRLLVVLSSLGRMGGNSSQGLRQRPGNEAPGRRRR